MRANSYQALMDDLARLNLPPEHRKAFEELLRKRAALDGVAVLNRWERVQLARRLLDRREDRAVICLKLQETFGIGRTQAYDDISKALQIVRKTAQ